MQILPDISGIGGCSTTANWKALRDASAFIGSDPLALIHFNGLGVRQLDPEQPNVRKWRFMQPDGTPTLSLKETCAATVWSGIHSMHDGE